MERYAVLKRGYTVYDGSNLIYYDFDPGELVIVKSIDSLYIFYRIYKLDRSVSSSCNREDFDFFDVKWLEIRVK